MNSILFASVIRAFYFPLDCGCLVLSVLCGYLITRRYMKGYHQSGFLISLITGLGIGVLLILDDGIETKNYLPQYGRILIGAIGGILGHFLYKTGLSAAKKSKKRQKTKT
jgi:uncharacterized membrane protein YeaQ/YmgE (transglycosylase-associated protein family)